MRNIYIYVDDIRTDDGYYNYLNRSLEGGIAFAVVARDYEEAILVLNRYRNENIIIDLDHDLGFDDEQDIERNGYDICRYIVENEIPLLAFHIHSMNPVGCSNMRELLTHYGYMEIN